MPANSVYADLVRIICHCVILHLCAFVKSVVSMNVNGSSRIMGQSNKLRLECICGIVWSYLYIFGVVQCHYRYLRQQRKEYLLSISSFSGMSSEFVNGMVNCFYSKVFIIWSFIKIPVGSSQKSGTSWIFYTLLLIHVPAIGIALPTSCMPTSLDLVCNNVTCKI